MDTTPEQAAEGMALVGVLAAVLERLVGANASLARADPGNITKFHALKAPGIGVLQYLERIHKFASCSNECFILALIYIDRLIQRNNFLLTELNVHRVVITAILLAAKFFDDAYYNNAYYAKVGGVLVSEMNGLEVDFLFRINFSLHVTPELFQKYRAELVSHSPNVGVSVPDLQQCPLMNNSGTTSPNIAPSLAGSMIVPTEVKSQTISHADYVQRAYGPSHNYAQITPSPPPPTSYPHAPPLQVVSGSEQQSMVFPVESDSGLVGNLSHSTSVLQRHHSMPLGSKGIGGALISAGTTPGSQQSCSSYSVNSAPAMIPVGVSPPVGVNTITGMETTEQYVVVDNIAYPVHGGMVHFQHNPSNMDVSMVSSSGYHQRHHSGGSVQSAQVGSPCLVNGQVLTGRL